jgi:hypothetical protein
VRKELRGTYPAAISKSRLSRLQATNALMNLAGEVLEFTRFLLEFHRKSRVQMACFQLLLQVLGKFDQLRQFPIHLCAVGFALVPSGSLPGAVVLLPFRSLLL